MNDEQYRELIKKIKGSCLLALPQSASRILELSKDPNNGPPEFAAAISSDLGLTTQILRFVNSSYFGFRNRITTIQMALSLVYGRTIKNFILWNAVFALLPNPKCGPFDLRVLCQDSLRRGIFARALAKYIPNLDAEELFLCALFQDMAIPILAQAWPREYEEILLLQNERRTRLSELENERFGWNHAIAGSILVEEWGFGEELTDAIEHHTDPDFHFSPSGASPDSLRRAVVAVSAFLPSVLDRSWGEGEAFLQGFLKLHRKGMPLPDILFTEVDAQVEDMMNIASLEQVPINLADFHRDYLAHI